MDLLEICKEFVLSLGLVSNFVELYTDHMFKKLFNFIISCFFLYCADSFERIWNFRF